MAAGAVVAANVAALLFQVYNMPHAGENTPTLMVYVPAAALLGTVQLTGKVRCTPALND